MGALLETRGSALSWCRRERIGGDGALAAGPRAGQIATLTREQELALIDTIRGHFPEDFGLPGDLWSRRSVAALASDTFDLRLTGTTIARILTTWGVTARDPSSRACALCAGSVERWMATAYPAIARTAHEHRADLHWIGRARLCGVAPSAEIVSAVSGPPTRPKIRFMIAPGGVRARLPRAFLLRLSGPTGRPIHAIVDGSWATWQLPRRLPRRVLIHPMPSCERLKA